MLKLRWRVPSLSVVKKPGYLPGTGARWKFRCINYSPRPTRRQAPLAAHASRDLTQHSSTVLEIRYLIHFLWLWRIVFTDSDSRCFTR